MPSWLLADPPRLAFAGDGDASRRGVVLVAMAGGDFVRDFVGRVLVCALEVVADRRLGVRRQCVHDLADTRLATRHGLPFRHARGRDDLWWHALDILGTAVVVAGVDHGLLLGHRRLVLLLR